MNMLHKARLFLHIVRWRLTWHLYDAEYLPPGLPSKFVSARQAASLIRDGATVLSCGMAGHHRASIFYWAIRDRYKATQHPNKLTWCAVGALGGRSKLPGTLEELGLPGLVTTMISGHLETVKSFLRLASAGQMELHTLPQGEFAFLIEGQANGVFMRESAVGVGTFLDPRCGPGSAVTNHAQLQLIEPADTTTLRYHLPKLDVTLFNVPYADVEGNIYVNNACCLTEIRDSAYAVKANGGLVLATVATIIPKKAAEIYLPAAMIDAIVVNPRNEQTGSVPQQRYWPMFTPNSHVNEKRALGDIRFINEVMKITPRRSEIDKMLARLAATIIVSALHPGALMNIGVGLPEEASRLMYEAGINQDLHQTTETGVYGGVPCSGIFFGAAVNPTRQESSSWVFHEYEKNLDLACLGMLELDSAGNINVSRRGDDPRDYVGPGGLTNITHYAKTIVFVGAFAHRAKMRRNGDQLLIEQPGSCKFVPQVREVTFNGAQALARGKQVWYITHVGVFKLTAQGVMLVQVTPGVDIQRDILAQSKAKIVLPPGGPAAVQTVSAAIVSGKGFRLRWPEGVKP